MKKKRLLFFMALMLSAMILSSCQFAEVRSLEEDAILKEGFRADQYVRDKWDTEIVPTYVENAHDLRNLLEQLNESPSRFAELGNQESQGEAWNFMVQSEAVIVVFGNDEVIPELALDIPPYDGETDIILVMGPPILPSLGFQLRDASGTIGFNEFINQEEHGAVANELLARAQQEIALAFGVDDPGQIKELSPEVFEGQAIQFYGAMQLSVGQDLSPENWKAIEIVPVQVEVLE